jgi:hypothetical protein
MPVKLGVFNKEELGAEVHILIGLYVISSKFFSFTKSKFDSMVEPHRKMY